MKKIISRILVILVCVPVAALWLTGCGFRTKMQENVSDSQTEISLEVWFCYDRNVPGAYYVFLWDTLAEQYGYEIEIETYSAQEIQDKLKMGIVCNELPDIFYVPGGNYAEYLFESGACMPVQDYLEGAGFLEKYTLPSEDGNNYIIPCMADSYAVAYYDSALLEEIGLEVPSSWEELEEMVKKVNQYNQENGTEYTAVEMGMKDKWMGELFYCMTALQTDQEIYHMVESGTASENAFAQLLSESSAAVRQMMDLGAFPVDYMEIGESEAVRNFINHDAVMMVHQSSLVYHLIQNMGQDGFCVSAFPGTVTDTGEQSVYDIMNMNATYTPGLAVSAGSEFKEEAAQLSVEFALSVNQTNVEQHGYLNMTESAFSPANQILSQVQFIHELEDNVRSANAFLFSAIAQDTGDEWGNIMKQFYAGEIDTGEFSEKITQFIVK